MNKPAFPRPTSKRQSGYDQKIQVEIEVPALEGMSLLEYYAGQVMQGLMANPERYKYISHKIKVDGITQEEATIKNVNKAFLIAEAMLREAEKRNP